jgi:hypothetical protein
MTLQPVTLEDELLPARADTDSWTTVVESVALLAAKIAETEFVPRDLRGSIPATAAAILYGREVGLPPMTALSQIAVVEGRPGLSAEAMRALVLAAGHEITFDESTTAKCVIRGRRHRTNTWTTVEWTLDMAQRAGLIRPRSAWTTYPRNMLQARATTELCRLVFPDVIHGFRSVEELGDMDVEPPPEPARKTTTVRRTRKTAAKVPPSETSLPEEDKSPGEATAQGSPSSQPPPPPDTPLPIDVPTYAAPVPQDEPPERLINTPTRRMLMGQLKRLQLDDASIGRERRLALLATIAGRDELSTSSDLTQTEAGAINTVLATARDAQALDELLAVATASEIAEKIAEEEEKS